MTQFSLRKTEDKAVLVRHYIFMNMKPVTTAKPVRSRASLGMRLCEELSSWGKISINVMYIKVPAARPSKVERASWCCGVDWVSVRAMPSPIPSGDITEKSSRQPATAACRSWVWVSLSARLKEMTLLWSNKAKQIPRICCLSCWSPTASPSNTECRESENTRMKERMAEWELKSTWRWTPSPLGCLILSGSSLAWAKGECKWLRPMPFLSCDWILGSTNKACLSPVKPPDLSLKTRTICSITRTRKKPMARMNSGSGNCNWVNRIPVWEEHRTI